MTAPAPTVPKNRWIAALPVALVCLAPVPAAAQMTGDQAVAAAQASSAKDRLPPDSFSGALMLGRIGEDVYATLGLRLNFDRENWGVGFGFPLRLRVLDVEPEDGAGFRVRKEDWDEPGDFLRILRYVYVGQADKKGPFYVRLGELGGLTIGHGTIVYRYYNGFDIDRWRVGTNVAVNIDAFGAEAAWADLTRPGDSALAGARFTVRPLQLAMGEGFFTKRLVTGVSFFADPGAPVALTTDAMGSLVLDEEKHPEVAYRDTAGVIGADVGLELLEGNPLTITPYIDLNKITHGGTGLGLHIGVLWAFRFPLLVDTLVIDLRTEYRRVSADYLGPYFNTAHEIERYEFPPGSKTPKLGALRILGDSDLPGKNGVFFDILAGLPEYVYIGGEYVDYDGGFADGTIRLSLEVPALDFFQFSAFYYRVNITGLNEDLFALDDRSAIVAEAKIPLYMIFTLNLRWWRLWQAEPGEQGNSYKAVDDWSIGVGFHVEI